MNLPIKDNPIEFSFPESLDNLFESDGDKKILNYIQGESK